MIRVQVEVETQEEADEIATAIMQLTKNDVLSIPLDTPPRSAIGGDYNAQYQCAAGYPD